MENFVKSSEEEEGNETTVPTRVTSFWGDIAASSSKFCNRKDMFAMPKRNIKKQAIPNLPLKKCLLIETNNITNKITERQVMQSVKKLAIPNM